MKRVLQRKTTKFLNESISFAYPPIFKKKLWAQLKTYLVKQCCYCQVKTLGQELQLFWAIDYVSISNDLASSLIYHHWCLDLNVSVIWHEIQSFVGSSWILTSSSLLNVISTIAWVWESLAFGHNDRNLIDSNSIC